MEERSPDAYPAQVGRLATRSSDLELPLAGRPFSFGKPVPVNFARTQRRTGGTCSRYL